MSKSLRLKKQSKKNEPEEVKPELPIVQPVVIPETPEVQSDNQDEQQDSELADLEFGSDVPQDPTLQDIEQDIEQDLRNMPDDFLPMPPDYIIRQQQIATYQMLCQFLVHQDKNITDVLNDVRVSIDTLTKCVIQLNKTLEKNFSNDQRKNT